MLVGVVAVVLLVAQPVAAVDELVVPYGVGVCALRLTVCVWPLAVSLSSRMVCAAALEVEVEVVLEDARVGPEVDAELDVVVRVLVEKHVLQRLGLLQGERAGVVHGEDEQALAHEPDAAADLREHEPVAARLHLVLGAVLAERADAETVVSSVGVGLAVAEEGGGRVVVRLAVRVLRALATLARLADPVGVVFGEVGVARIPRRQRVQEHHLERDVVRPVRHGQVLGAASAHVVEGHGPDLSVRARGLAHEQVAVAEAAAVLARAHRVVLEAVEARREARVERHVALARRLARHRQRGAVGEAVRQFAPKLSEPAPSTRLPTAQVQRRTLRDPSAAAGSASRRTPTASGSSSRRAPVPLFSPPVRASCPTASR